jgi:chemotaxis regulatin CheY-phosphate phosphatase CheZ
MRIVLNIEEEDIERIARSLDNQYAYTLARKLEDSGYKRLADLFRGFLKRGPGQAASPSNDQPVRQKRGR